MTAGLFVTGTDTESGKTYVSRTLVKVLRDSGFRVAGFKPIAAGAEVRDGKLRNDDALTLMSEGGLDLPYEQINPYCFAPPVAPHLAASDVDVVIDPAAILAAFRALAEQSDAVIAEGAGGWLVPLSQGYDMADLALMLGLPVVMVVGLRLGCLNHARLTEQMIRARGAKLAGWVGSQVDPNMSRVDENLKSLDELLLSPCLGVLAHPEASEAVSLARPITLQGIAPAAGLSQN